MKQLLFVLTILGSATFAHAVDLKCTLFVDGDTAVSTSKGSVATVSLKGFYCAGSTNGSYTVAHLYEPGESDDDDATKRHALDGQPAVIDFDDVQCSCEVN